MQHFVQQLAENDGLKLSLYAFSATVVTCCQAQSPAPTGAATQHVRGLHKDHAPQVGYRCAGLGLQGRGSKQPALVDPAVKGNGLDDF